MCGLDLCELLRFHKSRGLLATVTAVRPPSRFGGLVFAGDRVAGFRKKHKSERVGLMVASWSSNPDALITSTTTAAY